VYTSSCLCLLREDGTDVENDLEEGTSSQCKTSRPVVASDEEAACSSSGTVTAAKRSAPVGMCVFVCGILFVIFLLFLPVQNLMPHKLFVCICIIIGILSL